MKPVPLPREPLVRALKAHIAAHLPKLRAKAIPPCRHSNVTLLLYCFPPGSTPGNEATKDTEVSFFDPFEFALRQTWDVLGALPTVIVTPPRSLVPEAFAAAYAIDVQIEPRLVPGHIETMSEDCIARLHTRFATSRVLIVQSDGWPVRDELEAFLCYDFVGAPNVNPGWRAAVSDALALTVLNGGFSIRSRRLCRFVAGLWKCLPMRRVPSEDHFYARLRPFFRFPSAAVARSFSEDTLDGLLPPAPRASPMGFHRDISFAVLFAPETPLTVVSVVRDTAFHARCLRDNPHLAGARFVVFDNTVDNRPIPERYNAFLDTMPVDTGWILFAHEDFELKEDPRPHLRGKNPLFPYGLIGTRKVLGFLILPFGALTESDRDGCHFHINKPPLPYETLLGTTSENFDCCGFFVHADAFRTWGLRFDPRCAWDLYAEDLCFQFIQKTGHRANILPLNAHHWSRGNPRTDRFRATLAYLNGKYKDFLFAGGTCTLSIGGLPPLRMRLYQKLVHFMMPWRFR